MAATGTMISCPASRFGLANHCEALKSQPLDDTCERYATASKHTHDPAVRTHACERTCWAYAALYVIVELDRNALDRFGVGLHDVRVCCAAMLSSLVRLPHRLAGCDAIISAHAATHSAC